MDNIHVGKGGIYVKIIADSLSPAGTCLTTMELTYPRFIHAEFMTHRLFSRNASSSRAIPVAKMLEQVRTNPAKPIYWGKNKPGMQATEQVDHIFEAEQAWSSLAREAAHSAYDLDFWGVHKQVTNRVLEPFQFIKVIVTATEWDNFFKLRRHPSSQPEMQELAHTIHRAMANSEVTELKVGEWHLPYVTPQDWAIDGIGVNTLRKCSAARCARVSYMNHDNSAPEMAKDIVLADKLLKDRHMSPFEHQATPMVVRFDSDYRDWEKGVTHCTSNDGEKWSANFRGFIQNRQLMECNQ